MPSGQSDCSHALVVEESAYGSTVTRRLCLLCGLEYDRSAVLERLKEDIRERHSSVTRRWATLEREDAQS